MLGWIYLQLCAIESINENKLKTFEILLGLFLVAMTIFMPGYKNVWFRYARVSLFILTGLVIAAVLWYDEPTLQGLGITKIQFRKLAWTITGALAFCTMLLVAGWALQTMRYDLRSIAIGKKFMMYLIATGTQQWITQMFLVPRLRFLFGHGRGSWYASLIFGAMHLPNPALSLLTIPFCRSMIALYDRQKHLYGVWLSHNLVGATFSIAFASISGSMAVGINYLHRMNLI